MSSVGFRGILLLFLTSLIPCSGGFLLPYTQKPPTGSAHYNFLFDLLVEERQARKTLESYVSQMQSEICSLQQCKSELSDLKNKYDLLEQKHSDIMNKTTELETKLKMLEQLKTVSDLREVINLQNRTDSIAHEVQTLNVKQAEIINNENVRKDDFIAIYHRVLNSESKLENLSLTQTKRLNDMLKSTDKRFGDVLSRLNTAEQTLRLVNHTLSYDVAFSASLSKEISVSGGSTIKFDTVWTNIQSGYNPNTGVFTAPVGGLYFFTCTLVSSGGTGLRGIIYKNGNSQSVVAYSRNDLYTGNVHAVLTLNKGDRVDIRRSYSNEDKVYSESAEHFSMFTGFKI